MKILLALDALAFDKAQFDYPAYIAELTTSEITVLFLENTAVVHAPFSKYGHLSGYQLSEEESTESKKEIIYKNIEAYKQLLTERNVRGNLLRARGIPKDETIEASRFADLLMISHDLSFASSYEETPTKFVEEVLTGAQCAVLVMPKTMQEIKEVVFTCNGSLASMFSIRQFTYLFPNLKDRKFTLLYVLENPEEETTHKKYIKEYMHHHYKNWEFKLLTGNPSAVILSYLSKQRNSIVTFGAYGRSQFSQFFKKSEAESTISTVNMPVFITHP